VQGPLGALVTLVEFSEFQCASCAALDARLQVIASKYGDKIRVVWKNKPLTLQPAAEPAAQAALEVRSEKGDGAFWKVHDAFVDRTADLVTGTRVNVDAIVKIAAEAGANPEKVRKAIAERSHEREIEEDLDLAEDLEVESTPSLFINGRRFPSGLVQPNLERMIDEEIQRAQDLIAKGTAPEALYQTIVGGSRGPWRPSTRPLLSIPGNDPALGPVKADVTVHVWGDYQCASCNAVERAMAVLRKEHPARVRFVWHDVPLLRHRDARRLAEAAREAFAQKGAAGFWAMHDKIFAAPQVPVRSDLDQFAQTLGLDMTRWAGALDGHAHAAEIAADEAAAHDEGVTETPTFFVVAGDAKRAWFVGNIEYPSKLGRVVETALDGEEAEE
jgi:protein-disulfide isomerase